VIVVDASAMLEALLRPSAAAAMEERSFDRRQTLHGPISSTLKSRKSFAAMR
jgi:hypothetical protein